MALMYSNGMPVGSEMPPFRLPATDGNTYSADSFADAELLVLVFTCNHCPYAIASEDRLITLQKDFCPRGVQFVLINPNDAVHYPADSFENMAVRKDHRPRSSNSAIESKV